MKWIALQDKFPESYEGVLVTDGVVVTAAELTKSFGWTGHEFGGYEWEWDFNEEEITHWMPLPELPKGEQINE